MQRHRPCPTFDFFNEEAIGGLVQGDAAGDSFRASAGSCASANRSNRTSAAAISCLLQGHGLEQGDAAGDGFRASAGSCASANRSNRTYAAAMSCLLQGQPAGLHGAVPPPNPMPDAFFVLVASAHNPAARQQIVIASRRV